MHICHDYTAKLLANARMSDLNRRSANGHQVRKLRLKYRRQLILWLRYMLKQAGKFLVSWGERNGYPGSAGSIPAGREKTQNHSPVLIHWQNQ